MNNSCFTSIALKEMSQNALNNMSEEQKETLGITGKNEAIAKRIIESLTWEHLTFHPHRHEIEEDVNKYIDFLMSLAIDISSSEDADFAQSVYNEFMEDSGDSRYVEFDTSDKSQEEVDEMLENLSITYAGMLYTTFVPSENKIYAMMRTPETASSEQEATIERLRKIDNLNTTREYLTPEGNLEWLPLKSIPRRGWKNTGRYKYRGQIITPKTVSKDVYGEKEDEVYPVMASPIGNTVDSVGREFFNGESDIHTDDGIDEAKLRTKLEKGKRQVALTKKGLHNLVGDFERLEEQLNTIWPGCRVISDEIQLFGQTQDNDWVTGKPDLFVIDKDGVIHVIDFKTRKIGNIDTYQTSLENFQTGENYGKQITRYIRMLQSYGFKVDESPYIVQIDTWYVSTDYGEDNDKKENSEHVYDYNEVSRSYEIAGEDAQSIQEYAEDREYGVEDVLLGTQEERILYMEPRLHTASDFDGSNNFQYSSELAALRSSEDSVTLDENAPTYMQQYLDANEDERAAMDEIDGKPKERELGQGIVRYSDDIEDGPVGSQELREVARMLMNEVSVLIDFIQDGAEFEDIGVTADQKLKGKTRAQIIKSVGINNLINFIFETRINTVDNTEFDVWDRDKYPTWEEYRDSDDYYGDAETEEEFNEHQQHVVKAQWIVSHKDEFLMMGYQKLMSLEDTIKPIRRDKSNKATEESPAAEEIMDDDIPIPDSGDNESTDEFVEQYIEGLTDIQAWLLGQRNYSPKASLAKEIRRMLERTVLYDAEGNVVQDPYGWHCTMTLDSTTAMQTLLNACGNCESWKEMREVLEGLAQSPQSEWVKDVLEKLDRDKTLQTKFYRHFRKDALTYSVSTYKADPVTGERVVETRIINTRPAYATIMDSLGASFREGNVGKIIEGGKLARKGSGYMTSYIISEKEKIKEKLRKLYIAAKKQKEKSLNEYVMDAAREQEGDEPSIIQRITSVLQGIGILVDEDVVERCWAENVARSYSKSNAGMLLDLAEDIAQRIEYVSQTEGVPDDLHGNKAYGWYKDALQMLSGAVESVVEDSVYENGKTYYSYTNPSRLMHIIRNLKDVANSDDGWDAESKFSKYIEREYGRYTGWFKTIPDEEGKSEWLNDWIEQLATKEDARKALAHKVELTYVGNHYRDLGSLGFQLSILHNYFGTKDDPADTRWFALPTMSNKPTNEFIRMKTYKVGTHINQVIDKVLMKTFQQETNRMADVLYHFATHTVATDQMDITDDKLKSIYEPRIRAKYKKSQLSKGAIDRAVEKELHSMMERLRNRILNSEVTLSDLLDLGRITSGAKFHFLWYLNSELANEENKEFAQGLVTRLNLLLTPNKDKYKDRRDRLKESYSEIALRKATRDLIQKNMDAIVKSEIQRMHDIGLFDTKTVTRYEKGEKVTKTVLKYWDEFGGKLGEHSTVEDMERELKKFIWQDIAANINIIQITGGDLAYYGNAVNYQKRIAMMHSPGLKVMSDPEFDDGYLRSVHIQSMKAVSEVLENASVVLNRQLESMDPANRKEYAIMVNSILKGFKKIDVTDGQSFSSITSIKKKLQMQGEWDDRKEEAYNEVIKGNFNIENLGVLSQPMKPFVTTDMAKYSGSPTMTLRKTPLQDKNSEYLIILAEAISRGAGKQSKMSAIFDFMERTARDDENWEGNPETNRHGIDTVHFDSVAKVGLTGVIDIDMFDKAFKKQLDGGRVKEESYSKLLSEYMLKHVRREDSGKPSIQSRQDRKEIDRLVQEGSLAQEEAYYNPMYVDTVPVDDYIIQQEVPAHLLDPNGQLFGSQIRILGISDITPGTKFRVRGEKEEMDASVLAEEMKKLHAENIAMAFNSLMEELGLKITIDRDGQKVSVDLEDMQDMTPKQRDDMYKRLSYILRKEIVKDAKYGLDSMRACSLNYDKLSRHVIDFNVPLLDPIQSKRIQMLLNSIIKKVINKQKINGGPVVQTTAYDNDLHIRFQDKDGNILDTLAEFREKHPEMDEDESLEKFRKYLDENQAGIAYFECYMPVPNAALEKLITKEDGSLMTPKEVQELMPEVWESMSQVIGYRIPTEDKYSMLPLKIVDFVPRAAGQVIMMPKEITYLTGSDFDIDKMYIMMKAFDMAEVNTGEKAKQAVYTEYMEHMKEVGTKVDTSEDPFFYENVGRIIENAANMIAGNDISFSDGIRSKDSKIPKLYYDFIEWYREKLLRETFTEYADMDAKNARKAKRARDNRMLDLQWAVLTNEDTASKVLNPGNFDPQKKVGRVIRVLKSGLKKAEDYDNLMGMEISELDSLLEGGDQHNITLPSSKIYFQRQNMQGTQMVGIFANNNVSHAFCSFQQIGLNLEKEGRPNTAFRLYGHPIGFSANPSDISVLDRQRDFRGQLISKTIASFLAASVDTAKDPVLNDLNVNTFTGSVAMTLARLGFDTEQIGLFLSQPVIVMLSDHYFKNKTDGYYGGDTAIQEVAAMLDMTKEDLENPTEMGIKSTEGLQKDGLIEHLSDRDFLKDDTANGEKKLEYQKKVLVAFKILFNVAKDLQELTFCTKFNSVSNAVGPTVADTMEDADRVQRFIDSSDTNVFYVPNKKDGARADAYGFTDATEVIENDRILSAFFDNTVGDGGASERIFSLFFPHYYTGFQNMLQDFKDRFTRNGKLPSKTYNQLLDEYMYYLLTYDGRGEEGNNFRPVLPYSEEDKDALVKNLIGEFEEVIQINHRPNVILDKKLGKGCLTVRRADKYLATDVLAFNGAQMNAEAQDMVKAAWSDLIQSNDPDLTQEENRKLRRFGTDLFFYTLMRNGFGFSPKTLMHLASVIVRQNATYTKGFSNYIDGLKNLKAVDEFLLGTDTMFKERFIDQFIRNHAHNRSLVPSVQDIEADWDRSRTEGTLEFYTSPSTEYKLHKIIRTGGSPYPYIAMTYRDSTGELKQDLYRLDPENPNVIKTSSEVRVKYVRATRLGVVNNFIEYNANEDLEDSYFAEIRKNSLDDMDDEDTAHSVGREEQSAGDSVFSDMEVNNMFIKAMKNLSGLQAESKGRREKLLDMVKKSTDNDLAKLVRTVISKEIDGDKRQEAMDKINKIYEEQNKCGNL